MRRPRSRRVADGVVACVVVLMFSACHGGGAKPSTSPGTTAVDSKGACAALAGLQRSSDALKGVDVADPGASLAALAKAVDEYSAALLNFERVGPVDLRARAAAVRAAVIAHHFTQATAARAAIDVWAAHHCAT